MYRCLLHAQPSPRTAALLATLVRQPCCPHSHSGPFGSTLTCPMSSDRLLTAFVKPPAKIDCRCYGSARKEQCKVGYIDGPAKETLAGRDRLRCGLDVNRPSNDFLRWSPRGTSRHPSVRCERTMPVRESTRPATIAPTPTMRRRSVPCNRITSSARRDTSSSTAWGRRWLPARALPRLQCRVSRRSPPVCWRERCSRRAQKPPSARIAIGTGLRVTNANGMSASGRSSTRLRSSSSAHNVGNGCRGESQQLWLCRAVKSGLPGEADATPRSD